MTMRHRNAAKTRGTVQTSRSAALTEQFMTRTPEGFHAALRRLVGQRMAVSGAKVTHGALLMELVERALEQNAEGN